jgi:hypothetical protein
MNSAEQLVKRYHQRGDCSENRIKEQKIGFGMERIPCGQFEANQELAVCQQLKQTKRVDRPHRNAIVNKHVTIGPALQTAAWL